jgi:hypothetical protein
MSEHIYDAIATERRDSQHEDKRLEAMVGVLTTILVNKGVITMDEATRIFVAENIFEAINKEIKK